VSGTFDIFDDGTGSYSLAEINIVNVKLKQGLEAYGYGPTFSLLGDDGNTYNFINNIPNNNNTNNNNNPSSFNNTGNFVPPDNPNFIPVIEFSNLNPATPTSNTTTFNTTSNILIISSVVLASYYYKIKYSQ
jgi:hypothetical protein